MTARVFDLIALFDLVSPSEKLVRRCDMHIEFLGDVFPQTEFSNWCLRKGYSRWDKDKSGKIAIVTVNAAFVPAFEKELRDLFPCIGGVAETNHRVQLCTKDGTNRHYPWQNLLKRGSQPVSFRFLEAHAK